MQENSSKSIAARARLGYLLATKYRVTHILANLGWVDFDFGYSTLCLVLPRLMGNWQKWLSSRARWWNIPNQSQPNPGSPDGCHAVQPNRLSPLRDERDPCITF